MDVDIQEDEGSSPASQLPRFELTNSIVTAVGRSLNPSTDAAGPIGKGTRMGASTSMTDQADTEDSDSEQGNQYEYVTHVERNCDGTKLAAALSSREIKLYARDTMCYEGDLTSRDGHAGPVTQLAFSPKERFAMFSASEDGSVKAWDTRTAGKSVATFGQSNEEIWSMALGYDGNLCATGKGCTVELYDIRKAGRALGTYSECHTDAVTQVAFNPHKHSFLVTGSEDGLMCFFDTGVSAEEDALDSVMNAECAVRTVGFFGREGEGLYCCTNTETLSLWHAHSAQRFAELGDVRSVARGEAPTEVAGFGESDSNGEAKGWGVSVDYIVGCRYEAQADTLWLVAGGFGGSLCLASVAPSAVTPKAVLEGGHREQIRTFDWLGSTIITGGEDAKLCLWTAPGSEGHGASMQNRGTQSAGSGDAAAEGCGTASGGRGLQSSGGGRRGVKRAGRAFQPYDLDGRKR